MADFSHIFTLPRKPAPKLRRYEVTFPCGSTWVYDRFDLDVPIYDEGEQTGITYCFETLREANETLAALGYTVRRLKE